MTRCKLTIDKSARGWSYLSEVKYEDWPNWTRTSGGERTLACVLWHVTGHYYTLPEPVMVEQITVKGKPMSNADALAIIIKDLGGSGLDYAIPRYEKLLRG